MAQGGRLGVVGGATVTHVAETTASRHPWTIEARGRDWHRLKEKWGEAW